MENLAEQTVFCSQSHLANESFHAVQEGMMLRKTGLVLALSIGLVLLFSAFAILTAPAAAPVPDSERLYVINNVRILDVEAGAFGPPTSITIRDGVIASIGNGENLPAARVVDGQSQFLIPGFWDMHVHSFQLSPQLHFPLFVGSGVTSVRDMMDCPEETDSLIACVGDKRQWAVDIDAGKLAGPRIVEVASFYFDRSDLTPAETTARARAYSARGIDALKVYNRLTPEAYRTAANSADDLDLRLVGHLPKRVSLDDAIDAGQDSFEHARLFIEQCYTGVAAWRNGKLDDLDPTLLAERMVRKHDPEACRKIFAAMKQADAWFVPTHVTREEDARASDDAFVNDPRLDYLDPLSRWAYGDDLSATAARYPGFRGKKALAAYFEHGLQLTGEAHRAGVRILVGTDSAIGGARYHDEMAHLVKTGLQPAEVLRAATIEAARYSGLENESGSIAVGKRADLVLLGGNPLEDIGNTRKIESVWLAGRLYDREGLDQLLSFTEAQAGNPANWVRLVWGFARSHVSGEL